MGQIKNIKLHIVTDIKVFHHHGQCTNFSSSLRTKKDGNSCRLLQKRQRSDQSERSTIRPRGTGHTPHEGPGTGPHHRKGTIRIHRHPCQCARWWTNRTSVCYTSGHCESHRCLLPEVRRRGIEERDQRFVGSVRSFVTCC